MCLFVLSCSVQIVDWVNLFNLMILLTVDPCIILVDIKVHGS